MVVVVIVRLEAHAASTPQGFIEQVEPPRDGRALGYHPRLAERGTLAQSVCSFGTLRTGMGPGSVPAPPFLPYSPKCLGGAF